MSNTYIHDIDTEGVTADRIKDALIAHDDQRLMEMTSYKGDKQLDGFEQILYMACVWQNLSDRDVNVALVKKLLNLPKVQKSPYYKHVIANVYSQAALVSNPNPEVLKLLLSKFKGEQQAKDESLKFVFLARTRRDMLYRTEKPNMEAEKMLVQSGANIAKADSEMTKTIETELKEQKDVMDAKRIALQSFKTKALAVK